MDLTPVYKDLFGVKLVVPRIMCASLQLLVRVLRMIIAMLENGLNTQSVRIMRKKPSMPIGEILRITVVSAEVVGKIILTSTFVGVLTYPTMQSCRKPPHDANNSSHAFSPLLVRIATMEAVSVELGHLTNYVQGMGGIILASDVDKCKQASLTTAYGIARPRRSA
ncbi:hypothetical protein KKHLCK_05480 [Candidatus Electrothrix laxa]